MQCVYNTNYEHSAPDSFEAFYGKFIEKVLNENLIRNNTCVCVFVMIDDENFKRKEECSPTIVTTIFIAGDDLQ